VNFTVRIPKKLAERMRKHDTKQVSRPMGKNKDRRDSPPMSS
jgi:hypothetical protein